LMVKRITLREIIALMTHEGQIKDRMEDLWTIAGKESVWQIYGKSGRWVLTHDGGGPGFSTKIQLYRMSILDSFYSPMTLLANRGRS